MKKLALALMLCGISAFASTVTYSTSGAFGGPDLIAGTLQNAGATIAFNPLSSSSVNAPTSISLGSIVVSGSAGSFSGDTFVLTVNQTAPSAGSSSTSTSIVGLVTSTSNGITLTFSPTTFMIGTVTYNLQNSAYFLVAPNTNGGVTTLQANVTGVPEPASLGLIGSSLIGFGLVFRRRLVK